MRNVPSGNGCHVWGPEPDRLLGDCSKEKLSPMYHERFATILHTPMLLDQCHILLLRFTVSIHALILSCAEHPLWHLCHWSKQLSVGFWGSQHAEMGVAFWLAAELVEHLQCKMLCSVWYLVTNTLVLLWNWLCCSIFIHASGNTMLLSSSDQAPHVN